MDRNKFVFAVHGVRRLTYVFRRQNVKWDKNRESSFRSDSVGVRSAILELQSMTLIFFEDCCKASCAANTPGSRAGSWKTVPLWTSASRSCSPAPLPGLCPSGVAKRQALPRASVLLESKAVSRLRWRLGVIHFCPNIMNANGCISGFFVGAAFACGMNETARLRVFFCCRASALANGPI